MPDGFVQLSGGLKGLPQAVQGVKLAGVLAGTMTLRFPHKAQVCLDLTRSPVS